MWNALVTAAILWGEDPMNREKSTAPLGRHPAIRLSQPFLVPLNEILRRSRYSPLRPEPSTLQRLVSLPASPSPLSKL